MDEKRILSDAVRSARLEAGRSDLGQVYRLAYVSEVSPGFCLEDLKDIEKKSISRNAEEDITGILVLIEGKVLQVLEGSEEKVKGLFSRIRADSRHREVRQVSGGESEERLLSCWSLVGGQVQGAAVPAEVRESYLGLRNRWKSEKEGVDITKEEIELLKVVTLFSVLPTVRG